MTEMIFVLCLIMLFFSSAQADARQIVDLWSLLEDNEVPIMEVLSRDFICNSCLEASRKAQGALNDPKSFQGVGSLSSEVCHVLPSDLKAKCMEMSEAQINHSRMFLREMFHKKNLCNSTGLCSHRSVLPINEEIRFPLELTDKQSCLECRSSVKEVLAKLHIPSMRMKIMEALLEYCEDAEDNEKRCKQAVYRFAPQVLERLEKMKPIDVPNGWLL